jgi:hypothetical protein
MRDAEKYYEQTVLKKGLLKGNMGTDKVDNDAIDEEKNVAMESSISGSEGSTGRTTNEDDSSSESAGSPRDD